MGEKRKFNEKLMGTYTLDENHEPVAVKDLLEWGKWFEGNDRQVGLDLIGDFRISTVFLGMDHNYFQGESPILFETMVFDHSKPREVKLDGGPPVTVYDDLGQWRYSTWDEALEGHRRVVELAKTGNFRDG